MELFIRTTRQLRLSSTGERYIPLCERALLMLDQAKQYIQDDQDSVDDELRLNLYSEYLKFLKKRITMDDCQPVSVQQITRVLAGYKSQDINLVAINIASNCYELEDTTQAHHG